MPIIDLYEHSDQKHNLAHFATLASLAAVDGEINEDEKATLDKFAFKLNITEAEYKEVMKRKINTLFALSAEKRLRRLYQFFQMALADKILKRPTYMIERYAIGLGTPRSSKMVQQSVIFLQVRLTLKITIFNGR